MFSLPLSAESRLYEQSLFFFFFSLACMNILTLSGCFPLPLSLALRLTVQAGAASLPHGERSQPHVLRLLPLCNLNNYPGKTRQVALLECTYSSEYPHRSSRFSALAPSEQVFNFSLTQLLGPMFDFLKQCSIPPLFNPALINYLECILYINAAKLY